MSLTLSHIRSAAERLSGISVNTPLLENYYVNSRFNANVYFKLENCQHIGAFKFRGAYNRLCQLDSSQKKRGVVAFSSGNHAQGIALAAKKLGMSATIVMPSDAPRLKLEGTLRLGAKVIEYDRVTESRERIAEDIAKETGATLEPAFEDFEVMAGQGTVGLEIVDQLNAIQGGGIALPSKTFSKALKYANFITNALECDAQNCPPNTTYSTKGGLSLAGDDDLSNIIGKMGISSLLDPLLDSLDGAIPAVPSRPDCDTNVLKCGPPRVDFIGGGGQGATGSAIVNVLGQVIGVAINELSLIHI